MITKSDEHYRKIEDSGDPEPIVIQESLIDRLIKAGVDTRRALDVTMGQKHISRAGVKEGEDWSKEIQKAINYLTRGVTGSWIGSEEDHCKKCISRISKEMCETCKYNPILVDHSKKDQ